MTQLKLTLLGTVEFAIDDLRISNLPTRTEQALLVYLVCESRQIPRDNLIDIFYAESDPEQGRKNLRTALTRIKSKIGDVLLVDRNAIGLRADIEIVRDTVQFEAALAGVGEDSAESLQRLLTLYRGDFMDGFYLRSAPEFEHWQLLIRERLRMLAVQSYEQLIGLLTDSAEFHTALDYTNRLLAIEPLMEHIHRSKMSLLARMGQPAMALRHFDAARHLFEAELSIGLSESTHTLRSRIASLDAPPRLLLPPARSGFVGRQKALTQLNNLLMASDVRLITLFGSGGMGKTRLAVQVARQLYNEKPGLFLDGILFVDLTTVDSADTLIQTLAQSISLNLNSSQSPQEQLLAALKNREQLWILDNFEQLVDELAALDLISDILKEAPAVKLLVTSRALLNLYEESVFDVEGLSLPAHDVEQALPEADGYDAVTLFLTSARRRNHAFEPDDGGHETITTLCRLIDGSPLGIELAAGMLRSSSLDEIYGRVEDSLSALESALHNVPDRHRSLRAVFDYSWRLLSAEMQTLLATLSIFPGIFSLRAASAIANADADGLEALAQRSLVEPLAENTYQLHSLLREFSAEQLSDRLTVATRHADYFSDAMVERLEPAFSAEDTAWIQSRMPDLLLAWHHYLDHRALEKLHRLAHPTFIYFNDKSFWNTGINLFLATTKELENEEPEFCAMLNARAATIMINRGQYARSVGLLKRALDVLDKAEETYEAIMTMVHLGYAHAELGQFDEALTYIERGEKLIDLIKDKRSSRVVHHIIGIVYRMTGRFEAARKHLEIVLTAARKSEDMVSLGFVIDSIANLLMAMEKYEEALPYFIESDAILVEHGSLFHGTMVKTNIALLQSLLGLPVEAMETLDAAAEVGRQVENVSDQASTLLQLLSRTIELEHDVLASDLIKEIASLAQLHRSDEILEELFLNSAEFHLRTKNLEMANQLLNYLEQKSHVSNVGKQIADFLRKNSTMTLPSIQPTLSRDQLTNLLCSQN